MCSGLKDGNFYYQLPGYSEGWHRAAQHHKMCHWPVNHTHINAFVHSVMCKNCLDFLFIITMYNITKTVSKATALAASLMTSSLRKTVVLGLIEQAPLLFSCETSQSWFSLLTRPKQPFWIQSNGNQITGPTNSLTTMIPPLYISSSVLIPLLSTLHTHTQSTNTLKYTHWAAASSESQHRRQHYSHCFRNTADVVQ